MPSRWRYSSNHRVVFFPSFAMHLTSEVVRTASEHNRRCSSSVVKVSIIRLHTIVADVWVRSSSAFGKTLFLKPLWSITSRTNSGSNTSFNVSAKTSVRFIVSSFHRICMALSDPAYQNPRKGPATEKLITKIISCQFYVLDNHPKRTTPCQNSFVRNQFKNTGICIIILNNQTGLV